MRFRISSLEPMDCSDEIVDLVAASAVSRRIFISRFNTRAMPCLSRCAGRTRSAYYRRLVDRIREEIPHASIGTDIIVGFPGETDEDFAILEAYLRDAPITHVHVFPYSDRPGTAATALTGKVHGSIVRERASRRSRDRPRARPAVPSRAERLGASGADNRGWVARRDRQLSEGENSARPAPERVGDASLSRRVAVTGRHGL